MALERPNNKETKELNKESSELNEKEAEKLIKTFSRFYDVVEESDLKSVKYKDTIIEVKLHPKEDHGRKHGGEIKIVFRTGTLKIFWNERPKNYYYIERHWEKPGKDNKISKVVGEVRKYKGTFKSFEGKGVESVARKYMRAFLKAAKKIDRDNLSKEI